MAALAKPVEFQIEDFLAAEQAKDLLRFTTAGSVDDGKSTLIGRLLYDSQSVYEDQLKAVTKAIGQPLGGRYRFLAAHRRPARRTGAGHHHRRGVSLLRHRAAQVYHRRYAGARAVHAQHGHRRIHGRSGGDPDRRAQRRFAAIAQAWFHRVAARHPEFRDRGQQNGCRGLRRSRVPRHRNGIPRVCSAAWVVTKCPACLLPAHQRTGRRQRGPAEPQHAVVSRPVSCWSFWKPFRFTIALAPPRFDFRCSA